MCGRPAPPPSAVGGVGCSRGRRAAPSRSGPGSGMLPLVARFSAFTLCLLLVLSYTQRVKILPAQDRPSNGCIFKDFGSFAESLMCSEHTSLYPLLQSFGPGLLFWESFLIADFLSLGVFSWFSFSVSFLFSLRRWCVSTNVFILLA